MTSGHRDVEVIKPDVESSRDCSSHDNLDNSMMGQSSTPTGATLSKSNSLRASLEHFLAEAVDRYGRPVRKLLAHTPMITESEGETAIYLGTLDENSSMRSGFGVLYSNQVIKLGYWKDNELNGDAVLINDNKEVYEGEFEDGKITRGILRTSEGSLYEGPFKNFRRWGDGRESFPDGSLYTGRFLENLRHGKGELNLNDGSGFKGLFESGAESYGEAHFSDGSRYIGEWSDNKMHGKGKLMMTGGSVYEGQFVSGLMHGKGKLTLNDGSSFIGEFVMGSKSSGVFQFSDGSRYVGGWTDNKMHGKGKLIKMDGTVYDGLFANGMKEGRGQLMKRDGEIIEGTWESNRLIDSSNPPSQYESRRSL
jgi:hypothetical protein